MTRYAVGLHTSLITDNEAGETFAQDERDPRFLDYVTWLSAGGTPDEDLTPAAADVSPVPESITPLQARRALLGVGLLDEVEAFVAAQPREVSLAWEYAIAINRNDPLVQTLPAALGMSEEQIDDLFRMAATL